MTNDGMSDAQRGERGPWVVTAHGRAFYLRDPRPEEVFIDDIAHSTSQLCRFTGHTRIFMSVAHHALVVARVLIDLGRPDLELYGLLHDAHEAYYGDMSSPLKSLLPEYKAIEERGWHAVADRFGLPRVAPPEIKEADLIARAMEKRDVMPDMAIWSALPPPHPRRIKDIPNDSIRRRFLNAFIEASSDDEQIAVAEAALEEELRQHAASHMDE